MDETGNYAYYFEALGRGERQGARDSRSEHFATKDIEEALVRETVQNSLDARAGREPVRVRFALHNVSTASIPGFDSYVSALRSSVDQGAGTLEGAQPLHAALERTERAIVPVLYVHDFGTTGLRGNESDPTSGLSSLTNSSGVSSASDGRGGSFGIGAAVGVLASRLRAVAYLTRKFDGDGSTIYASWTHLAGHVDSEGVERHARGIFTDLREQNRLVYPRFREDGFGPFHQRDEPGTSVIVLDYRGADDDPTLEKLRQAALQSFWAAILKGDLILEGAHDDGEWTVDSSNLDEHLSKDSLLAEKTLPFRRALDEEPVTTVIDTLGEVRLHIKALDEGDLPTAHTRPLYTTTMRKPRMRIATWANRSIPRPYAAVLSCTTDEGNEFLRQMEGPSHDDWTNRGAPGQSAVLRNIKELLKQSLRSRFSYETSDAVAVPGLSEDLPDTVPFDDDSPLPLPEDKGVAGHESWERQSPERESNADPSKPVERLLPVPVPDGNGGRGDDPGDLDPVREQKPGSGESSKPRTRTGRGGPASGQVSVRTFSGPGDEWIEVRLRTGSDTATTTGVRFFGLDGADRDMPLTLLNAVDAEGRALATEGNLLKEVVIAPGSSTRLQVRFLETGKARIEARTDAA
ncbi:hypothetical protein [Brachybacterium muris]|uniref:Uncharacterized protein n=1 Tax=Brachybacterium muris UCD-AY4 TaxID=1249481 RepID=A0A022KW73_9MICO|nr:hypothetical protein [Brachybacterium muris]EYT49027.1 hypothetical protein D641_0109725 [Brachybacterium muris UCD-AY4]